MNLVFVSHCSFQGNSALHVYSIAKEMHRRGHCPIICVPSEPETVSALGDPPFPVLSYSEARRNAFPFPDQGTPTLIHAFSPREQVRELVYSLRKRYQCPYLVHLEDNEEAIVDDELAGLSYRALASAPTAIIKRWIKPWRTHPQRARSFLSGAVGVTALIDRLLELKPADVPGTVFWPGFDPEFAHESRTSIDFRRRLDLSSRDFVLVYTGDVHHSNLPEVRSLFLAVGLLRRAGYPALLLKTGWNRVDMDWATDCGLQDWVIDLGYLPRTEIPDLLRAADVLVQPGGPNRFNDYRFPSKLPEFLASGRPVILPRSNIGRYLRDGEEALLLDRGDAIEIFEKVSLLAADERLRKRLGIGGREFAGQRLSWSDSVEEILALYARASCEDPQTVATRYSRAVTDECKAVPRPKLIAFFENDAENSAETRAMGADSELDGLDPPALAARQADLASSLAIYGACYRLGRLDGSIKSEQIAKQLLAAKQNGMPFCICCSIGEPHTVKRDGPRGDGLAQGRNEQSIHHLLPLLQHEHYIRIDGAPLLLIHCATRVPGVLDVTRCWRTIARDEAALDLHLAAAEYVDIVDLASLGMDAEVELPLPKRYPRHEPAREGKTNPAAECEVGSYLALSDRLLAKPLPDHPLYRCAAFYSIGAEDSQPEDAFGPAVCSDAYRERLRCLTFQTLARSSIQEPLIFVDPSRPAPTRNRSSTNAGFERERLDATRDALREGIRTYWAIRGLRLTKAEGIEELHSTDCRRKVQCSIPV